MSSANQEEKGLAQILAELAESVPEHLVKRRFGWRDERGEAHWIDYIDWHTAADILDRVCIDWSYEVRDLQVVGDFIAVTAALTIKGVTRCGIGVGLATEERGIKGAEHDALKRAAVKFGLARSLYRPNKGRSTKQLVMVKADSAQDNEPATDRQLAAIYAIAKAKSLDAQLESMALFQKEPESLPRRAASELIEHLRAVRLSA